MPAWAAVADTLTPGVLGEGWEPYVAVAVAVARAGLPTGTPAPAAWCLIAAMTAAGGNPALGRTLARLTGHFHCDECDTTWPIADLLDDEDDAEETPDARIAADANGFRPPRGGRPLTVLPMPPTRVLFSGVPVSAAALSTLPDGRTILATTGEPADPPHRWDFPSGEPLPTAPAGPGTPGSTVAAVAVVLPHPTSRHDADPPWLAALRDGRTVVITGDTDGAVRVWDPTTGTPHGELFRTGAGPVRAMAVVGGTDVVIVSGDRTVDAWSTRAVTGQRSTMAPPAAKLAAIGHTSLVGVATGDLGASKPMVLCDRDGRVSIWETFGVRIATPLPPDPAHREVVAVAGRHVVTAGRATNTLRLWEPVTGAVALVPLDATPRCLLAVGTTLIVGTDTGATVLDLPA